MATPENRGAVTAAPADPGRRQRFSLRHWGKLYFLVSVFFQRQMERGLFEDERVSEEDDNDEPDGPLGYGR